MPGKLKSRNAKKQPKREQKTTEQKTKEHKSIWAFVIGVCSVLGVLGIPLALWPRIVVSPPSLPIDPQNAFAVSFDITNTSLITPLNDIGVSIGLGQVLNGYPNPEPRSRPIFDTRLFFASEGRLSA